MLKLVLSGDYIQIEISVPRPLIVLVFMSAVIIYGYAYLIFIKINVETFQGVAHVMVRNFVCVLGYPIGKFAIHYQSYYVIFLKFFF